MLQILQCQDEGGVVDSDSPEGESVSTEVSGAVGGGAGVGFR
jgi:hypothetical protein